jgi:hypothetical protein
MLTVAKPVRRPLTPARRCHLRRWLWDQGCVEFVYRDFPATLDFVRIIPDAG